MLSPAGNNLVLDGKPWTFSFSGLSDISRVEISPIGTKPIIGLALNNIAFTAEPATPATSTPEPGLLLGMGLVTGAGCLLCQKHSII